MSTEALEILRRNWQVENFDACKALAAMLPLEAGPSFAGAALDACLTISPGPREASEVVRISAERERWREGHAAFDAVRDLTLDYERGTPSSNDPHYVILFVAENAARIIYNATSPEDRFDDDSGAWLFLTLAQMVRCTESKELEQRIWKLFETHRTTNL